MPLYTEHYLVTLQKNKRGKKKKESAQKQKSGQEKTKAKLMRSKMTVMCTLGRLYRN